jgi:predicted NAD-dependent protein-ADP-ribosyltransferase YbiA (DUF1768 family)
MVLSRHDSRVNYDEIRSINEADKLAPSELYQIEINNIDIIIAIGKPLNTYEDQNIIYFPIYLVKYNDFVVQIGVYELDAEIYYNDYLDDALIDVDSLKNPLLYSFATDDMLFKERKVPKSTLRELVKETGDTNTKPTMDVAIGSDDEEQEEEITPKSIKIENTLLTSYIIPESRKSIFTLIPGAIYPKELEEETSQIARDIREKYHENKTDTWLQKYMKNKKYDIVENDQPDGDAFFVSIRDAFSTIGQQTSVNKLRINVSKEITSEMFSEYKSDYDAYKNSLQQDMVKSKELTQRHQELKSKYANTLERTEQQVLINTAKEVKEEFEQLKNEILITKRILQEYKFMDKTMTVEKLRSQMNTSNFWSETSWIVATLERILNIKLIILSSESYKTKDYDNVLQCGQLNDPILVNKGIFTPEFYILLDNAGKNFKLISYENKQIFKFKELPYDIKKLIVDKCMEKNAGTFNIIPEFELFRKSIKKTASPDRVEEFDELSEAKMRGLYDDQVTFLFYNKSDTKALPGKGNGEKIPKVKLTDFIELAKFPEWRRKLDTMWIKPFSLQNHKWSSVEHYYQANKFKKNSPEFYLSFTVESGTEMSKNPEMARGAGGSSGKYNGELVRPAEVKIDPEFYNKKNKQILFDANYAKFTQDEELKRLLLATKKAKLTKHLSGKSPQICDELMLVRDKIQRAEVIDETIYI